MRSRRVLAVAVAGALVAVGVTQGVLAQGKKGDPKGNNGTIKVDGVPFDAHPDNESQPGCEVQIDFYNYDQGAVADLELVGIPPTEGVTVELENLDIGGDPAGGGKDLDGSFTLDIEDELVASGVAPHPEQGWHLKLTIHATGSIGADVKHKVLWFGCPAVAAGFAGAGGQAPVAVPVPGQPAFAG